MSVAAEYSEWLDGGGARARKLLLWLVAEVRPFSEGGEFCRSCSRLMSRAAPLFGVLADMAFPPRPE